MLYEMKCRFTGSLGTYWQKDAKRTGGLCRPSLLPPMLQTALEALYGHYEKVYENWQKEGISVPPVFIVLATTRQHQSSYMILSLALNAPRKR